MAARLNIGVSADAKQASETFKELAADIKNVGGVSVEVGEGISSVEAAIKKLSSAPDTPMALARATAKAKVEIDELRASLEKIPASAEQMKKIEAALKQADAAMEAAVVRAGKLRESQEEVAQKMGLTAKGAESLGNSFGSLSGIMNKMADSSSKTSQSIAKVGFSVMALEQAFEFGYNQGTKINKFLQDHGNYLEKAIDKVAMLGSKYGEARVNMSGFAADIDLENAQITEHTRALAANIVARGAQHKATAEADAAIRSALDGWKSSAQQQRELNDTITGVAQKFNDMVKSGTDWRKEVEANLGPMSEFVKLLDEKKIKLEELPPALQEAVEYLKELQNAAAGVGDAAKGIDLLGEALSKIGTGETAAAISGIAEALSLIRLGGGDVSKAVSDNAEAFQALRDEAEGSYDTLDAFRKQVMDQMPAWQATELAARKYTDTIKEINAAHDAWAEARRRANEIELEAAAAMAESQRQAEMMIPAIESIGEAWQRVTGQAAGFTDEVRRATKAVEESSPQFNAFIESLAGVSDEYERMIPYVGALIADLERGDITVQQFNDAIGGMRVAFMQVQGVSGQMFGDIDTLFNKLNKLVNEFVGDERTRNRTRERRR